MKIVRVSIVGVNSRGDRECKVSELLFHDSVKPESIADVVRGHELLLEEEARTGGLMQVRSHHRYD